MVKLAYYSTRRDGSHGWLQLTLVGAAPGQRRPTRRLQAARGYRRGGGLRPDPPLDLTRNDFEALGIPLGDTRWSATAMTDIPRPAARA